MISDRTVRADVDRLFSGLVRLKYKDLSYAINSTDQGTFQSKQEATRVVNAYAVTQLPFVLLIDDTLPEDKQEYAAVYSEEGPITIDRIKEKL